MTDEIRKLIEELSTLAERVSKLEEDLEYQIQFLREDDLFGIRQDHQKLADRVHKLEESCLRDEHISGLRQRLSRLDRL